VKDLVDVVLDHQEWARVGGDDTSYSGWGGGRGIIHENRYCSEKLYRNGEKIFK
jgi:hypothetical protein